MVFVGIFFKISKCLKTGSVYRLLFSYALRFYFEISKCLKTDSVLLVHGSVSMSDLNKFVW